MVWAARVFAVPHQWDAAMRWTHQNTRPRSWGTGEERPQTGNDRQLLAFKHIVHLWSTTTFLARSSDFACPSWAMP